MNEKFTDNPNQDDTEIADKLHEVAGQTNAGAYFITELENKLKKAHKPKTSWSMPAFKKISPSFGWIALVIVFGLALSWSIRNLIPKPQPAVDATSTTATPNNTATPIAATPAPIVTTQATPTREPGNGYDFRGAKLFLNVPLPDSPAKASVYSLKGAEPATADSARALANQFGIQGEIYLSPKSSTNTNDYLITDGKQSLAVTSNLFFTYTADNAKVINNFDPGFNANAEAVINDFLLAHGFDYPHKIEIADPNLGYAVMPLSPDGFPMSYDVFPTYPMRVTLDENGQVLQVETNWMNYESAGAQTYGIITAKEAFQKLMDDSVPAGKIESFIGSSVPEVKEWQRVYPTDTTITIYGYAYSKPALDPSKPAFKQIDGYTITGSTDGFDALQPNTFVEATGQFTIENGIERFNVESWRPSPFQQDGVVGTLSRENGQLVIKTDQEQLTVQPDVPADVPIPFENAFIVGVRKGGIYEWTLIDNRATGGGNGGGGGGLGFYKLNLSGTPVPFPSPTAIPTLSTVGDYTVQAGDTVASIANHFGISVNELGRVNNLSDTNLIYVGQSLLIPGYQDPTEQKIQDIRGTLSIVIHKKADGTQTKEYNLVVYQNNGFTSYLLEGPNLNKLDIYNGIPIIISGAIQFGGAEKLIVDSYKIPFPDLKFQILKGTQKSRQLDGQTVIIFTTEGGKSYVEFMASTDQPTNAFIGNQGELIQQEVLIIPDESFGGIPVIHIYQSSILNGGPEMQVMANQITVIDETNMPIAPIINNQPNLTIDQVELAYYVSNPNYQVNDPSYSQRSPYIQPIWHFHGHYDNGTVFDAIVQALKPEYLLPELAPSIAPG